MSIQKGASPELAIKSLTTAVPMPREFKAYTDNTHFDRSREKVRVFRNLLFLTVLSQRTYKYSVLDVHDVEWEQPVVGTIGCVGAVFTSKVVFMENKKHNPIHLMTIVLLDEVEIEVMPDEKFIVYHMKAYMDRANPRLVSQITRLKRTLFH